MAKGKKRGVPARAQTDEGKQKGFDKIKRKRFRFKKKKGPNLSVAPEPNSETHQKSEPQRNTTEPKLAGLIFMCSEVTRTDCFKYRVFGLPAEKKSVVDRVKKGTKLFLYDVDQKLLYGVYTATSDGGLNLVPQAYEDSGKSYPAQVRFAIHKECLPLQEIEFKEAIRDNFFSKNKFNLELSSEQVRDLINAYRPLDKPAEASELKPVRTSARQVVPKKGNQLKYMRSRAQVTAPPASDPFHLNSYAVLPPTRELAYSGSYGVTHAARKLPYPNAYALPAVGGSLLYPSSYSLSHGGERALDRYAPSQAGIELLQGEALRRPSLIPSHANPYMESSLLQYGTDPLFVSSRRLLDTGAMRY